MEKSKIKLLERFDTVATIMPYFCSTHRAFLLLSSLCSASRHKLNEFYSEFVVCMREYCILLEMGCGSVAKLLLIPLDLFEICNLSLDEKNIGAFIKFIISIRESEGCYFNNHYMNSQIKIYNPIHAGYLEVEQLYPYVEIMKSIQIRLRK